MGLDLSNITDWTAWVQAIRDIAGQFGLSIGASPTPNDLDAILGQLRQAQYAFQAIGAGPQLAAVNAAISQIEGAKRALVARQAGSLINIDFPPINASVNPTLNVNVPADAVKLGALILGGAYLVKG